MKVLLLWKTVEVVHNHFDTGSIHGHEDGALVKTKPGEGTGVTGHHVIQGAGQHADLKCEYHSLLYVVYKQVF